MGCPFRPFWSECEACLGADLGERVCYALTRMKRPHPYLDNGFLELYNNTAERAMKPVALCHELPFAVAPEGKSP